MENKIEKYWNNESDNEIKKEIELWNKNKQPELFKENLKGLPLNAQNYVKKIFTDFFSDQALFLENYKPNLNKHLINFLNRKKIINKDKFGDESTSESITQDFIESDEDILLLLLKKYKSLKKMGAFNNTYTTTNTTSSTTSFAGSTGSTGSTNSKVDNISSTTSEAGSTATYNSPMLYYHFPKKTLISYTAAKLLKQTVNFPNLKISLNNWTINTLITLYENPELYYSFDNNLKSNNEPTYYTQYGNPNDEIYEEKFNSYKEICWNF